ERVYDPRVGRFLSIDPLTAKYPFLTPYQYASNRPIDGIDEDGLEWAPVKDNAGNITGYNWLGFENDGTPKAGTVAGDILFDKDGFNYSYLSDAKTKTGELLISPTYKGDRNYLFWTDHSPSFSYTINITQKSSIYGGDDYNDIKAAQWNESGKVQESQLYFSGSTTFLGIQDRAMFYDAKSAFGLTGPAT